MKEYLRSLEMQIKSTRRQITRENKKLKDMSSSLNDDLSGAGIKDSIGFMKTNMDKLVEASTKLAQLEDIYSSLVYEEEHK